MTPEQEAWWAENRHQPCFPPLPPCPLSGKAETPGPGIQQEMGSQASAASGSRAATRLSLFWLGVGAISPEPRSPAMHSPAPTPSVKLVCPCLGLPAGPSCRQSTLRVKVSKEPSCWLKEPSRVGSSGRGRPRKGEVSKRCLQGPLGSAACDSFQSSELPGGS